MESSTAFLTPEKTILEVHYASLSSRIFAQLIDLLVLLVGFMLLAIPSGLLALNGQGIVYSVLIVFVAFSPILYFILMEGLARGRTLGKMMLGIQVMMSDATPITFQAAIGRNITRVADFLPSMYFLGVTAVILTEKSQRLGDQIAKTIVVQAYRPGAGGAQPAPHHVGVHAYESAIGSLRKMTKDDYKVLKRLCDRYPELAPEAAERLMQEIWVPMTQKLEIKPNQGTHPLLLAEATVMKYSREHGLI